MRDLLANIKEEMKRFSPLQASIFKILANNPRGLSVQQIFDRLLEKKSTNVGRSRVSQILGELKAQGFVESEKRGRSNIYFNSMVVKNTPQSI